MLIEFLCYVTYVEKCDVSVNWLDVSIFSPLQFTSPALDY